MTATLPFHTRTSTAERLERGEVVLFPYALFDLPDASDLTFLRNQEFAWGTHKDIRYDLNQRTFRGRARADGRLANLLDGFSARLTTWLAEELPEYAPSWQLDRLTLRPYQEAVRSLRHSARNDLLHVDRSASQPSFGRRLLRVFVNLNESEPRVCSVSETFAELLRRDAFRSTVPTRTYAEWTTPRTGWRRLGVGPSHYDGWMRRFQARMRADEAFQDSARRRYWHFPPGSVWLFFSDALAHAVHRGQYAIDQSIFVPSAALRHPERSPLAQLIHAGQRLKTAA